jgi:hypothetical protein
VLASLLPPPSSLTVRAHWQLRGTLCSMLALSTLRCIIIMSGRGSLLRRSAWHMCPRRRTLQTFSQRLCLGRSLKLFTKLWAYLLLWSDFHIAWHFLIHECQLLVHRITPRGDLLIYLGSDVCEHCRTVGALFFFFTRFFTPGLYISLLP